MRLLILLLLICLDGVRSQQAAIPFDPYPYAPPDPNYPNKALICYSSLTSPDNVLICPESRQNFCMKEVVAVREKMCGATQYFGDVYLAGKCEFRKCARNCTDNYETEFYYPQFCKDPECRFTRRSFCCSESYCNTAVSVTGQGRYLALATSVFLGLALWWV